MAGWRDVIDPRITVGNLLTAATITLTAVWWTSKQEARIDALDVRAHRLEKADETMEGKIRVVGEKADAKLELLARDVGEMKVSLKGIGTNLDWIVRQNGGKDMRMPRAP